MNKEKINNLSKFLSAHHKELKELMNSKGWYYQDLLNYLTNNYDVKINIDSLRTIFNRLDKKNNIKTELIKTDDINLTTNKQKYVKKGNTSARDKRPINYSKYLLNSVEELDGLLNKGYNHEMISDYFNKKLKEENLPAELTKTNISAIIVRLKKAEIKKSQLSLINNSLPNKQNGGE